MLLLSFRLQVCDSSTELAACSCFLLHELSRHPPHPNGRRTSLALPMNHSIVNSDLFHRSMSILLCEVAVSLHRTEIVTGRKEVKTDSLFKSKNVANLLWDPLSVVKQMKPWICIFQHRASIILRTLFCKFSSSIGVCVTFDRTWRRDRSVIRSLRVYTSSSQLGIESISHCCSPSAARSG